MNENKPAPWLRFRDLQAMGIVGNRVQLARLQRMHGFPSGKLMSENTVIFSRQAVEDWVASRPDARSEATADRDQARVGRIVRNKQAGRARHAAESAAAK